MPSTMFGIPSDPEKFVKEEISPVLERMDRFEKKLDMLILRLERIEKLLTSLGPIAELLKKIPFLK